MGLTVCEKGSLDAVWLLVWVWGERGVRWDGGTLSTLQGEGLLILSGIQKDRPRAVGNLRPELRDPFQSPLWMSLRVTPLPKCKRREEASTPSLPTPQLLISKLSIYLSSPLPPPAQRCLRIITDNSSDPAPRDTG